MDCLLIADDLTGACDAAAPFAARGLRTSVILGDAPADAQVLSISTNSRDLPAEDIRRALKAAAIGFAARRPRLIFKKIDSTLRGNPGVEIDAALDAFGCRGAVVCPAFPGMHRVVEGGYLRVTTDPKFAPLHVATHASCRHIDLAELRAALAQGARILSLDAICDPDLDRIAAALLALDEPVLWAGSAGLASALARAIGGTLVPHTRPERPGPVLFCIGSDHPVTLSQIDALLAARHEHTLIRIARGEFFPDAVRSRPSAIVLSGGDTAALVCQAIGVQRIDLYDELSPGIPRGVLRGGDFDGTPVVTKSGGFGDRDSLIRIADYFSCPNL